MTLLELDLAVNGADKWIVGQRAIPSVLRILSVVKELATQLGFNACDNRSTGNKSSKTRW